VLGAAGRPPALILYYMGQYSHPKAKHQLTIISGFLRGRRWIHQADAFDKSKESRYRDYAFRVRLVEEDGQEGESVVVGCHQVRVGW